MDTLIGILICFVVAVIGGIIFRWRGGGEPVGWGKYMPRPVDQILFSSIYIAIAFLILDQWPAAILSIITVIMVSKGHGRNMDLGTFDNSTVKGGVKPEWYEGLIAGLYGRIPEYWYDALGMVVSGLTYTIPLGLFIGDPSGDYFTEGMILAASGALKGPAYMIAWLIDSIYEISDIYDDEFEAVVEFEGATSFGEFLTGFFLWGVAAAILLQIGPINI